MQQAAFSRTGGILIEPGLLPPERRCKEKGMLSATQTQLAKELSNDTASTSHDRGHAGEELLTANYQKHHFMPHRGAPRKRELRARCGENGMRHSLDGEIVALDDKGSRSDKAGPERSDEHPGRRTESRYAMIEQLLVQYGAKESCAGLRVSRNAFYRWKSGQESR
jgi:hypothetical protein